MYPGDATTGNYKVVQKNLLFSNIVSRNITWNTASAATSVDILLGGTAAGLTLEPH